MLFILLAALALCATGETMIGGAMLHNLDARDLVTTNGTASIDGFCTGLCNDTLTTYQQMVPLLSNVAAVNFTFASAGYVYILDLELCGDVYISEIDGVDVMVTSNPMCGDISTGDGTPCLTDPSCQFSQGCVVVSAGNHIIKVRRAQGVAGTPAKFSMQFGAGSGCESSPFGTCAMPYVWPNPTLACSGTAKPANLESLMTCPILATE